MGDGCDLEIILVATFRSSSSQNPPPSALPLPPHGQKGVKGHDIRIKVARGRAGSGICERDSEVWGVGSALQHRKAVAAAALRVRTFISSDRGWPMPPAAPRTATLRPASLRAPEAYSLTSGARVCRILGALRDMVVFVFFPEITL